MRLNQFEVISVGRLQAQEQRHWILAAATKVIASWRRSSYAPLFVVLLVWTLLFLLAVALVVSVERW